MSKRFDNKKLTILLAGLITILLLTTIIKKTKRKCDFEKQDH